MANPIIIRPAEGFGPNLRDVRTLADKVNYPQSFRAAFKFEEGDVLPKYQLCVGDDQATVIKPNAITLPNPAFSLDLNTGVLTFNEFFQSFDFALGFQVVRRTTGTGTVDWGFGIQQFIEGVGWVNVPDSTRHVNFINQDTDLIKNVTFSSTSNTGTEAGTQVRFIQATSDATKSVGLICARPLLSLPESPGFTLAVTVN